jgi:hypothetical protein
MLFFPPAPGNTQEEKHSLLDVDARLSRIGIASFG